MSVLRSHFLSRAWWPHKLSPAQSCTLRKYNHLSQLLSAQTSSVDVYWKKTNHPWSCHASADCLCIQEASSMLHDIASLSSKMPSSCLWASCAGAKYGAWPPALWAPQPPCQEAQLSPLQEPHRVTAQRRTPCRPGRTSKIQFWCSKNRPLTGV